MVDSKAANKIVGSKKLQKAAEEFYGKIKEAVAKSGKNIDPELRKGGIKLFRGRLYYTAMTRDSQRVLTELCLGLLGASAGNESDIAKLAWYTLDLEREDVANAKEFVKKVALQATERFFLAAPCRCVVLAESLSECHIGPVAIFSTRFFAEKLPSVNQCFIVTDDETALDINEGPDGTIHVGLGDYCWVVETQSAESNVHDEAKWLIYVALSIIRLLGYPDSTGPLAPRLGEIDIDPFIQQGQNKPGVVFKLDGASAGGSSLPPYYQISEELLRQINENDVNFRIASVFRASPGSVAERLKMGLGWMARGRMASDSTERLLFFFTALEALVSGNDKNAPVVETLARRVSSIITDCNADRAEYAEEIKMLYAERSYFVHRGSRTTHHFQARRIQDLTEAVCKYILLHYDLQMPLDDFYKDLKLASYGLPWK